MKRRVFLTVSGGSILLAACGQTAEAKEAIDVYKLSSCGCCGVWAEYMEGKGYKVNVHTVSDVGPYKQKYGVPGAVASCHTTRVAGYTVEGHVPVEVVDKLLAERPALDGIALPRMPTGSPGMPGSKKGTWTVYGLKNGKFSIYAKV